LKNSEVGMAAIMNRLLLAMNAHDLDAFVACFAPDYESQQPAHPGRAFRGRDQVRKNWEGVFAGVPDFAADLVLSAIADAGVEVGEWRWHGTHTDGSPFGMQGVIVTGVRNNQIVWGRLYMEPIEDGGANIDEMVQDTYRPPA
jgi:ketosteroid isomerase-like protein